MARNTKGSWTPEQIAFLVTLVEQGASATRACVVLRRPKLAVQNKARQLGKPFQDVREVKAARLEREVSELNAIGRIERTISSQSRNIPVTVSSGRRCDHK